MVLLRTGDIDCYETEGLTAGTLIFKITGNFTIWKPPAITIGYG
jgi:hypothetical protein